MHKLYSNSTTTLSLWNLSHFSQRGSKTENQGHFKPSIEDITLTYKLISLKQLDIFFYGKRKRFYVMKSLTTIWQFTSVWILLPELPAKVAKTELNTSFWQTNELTTFSRCVHLPVNPLYTQNTFDFSCWLRWSTDEIMRLSLDSCTSNPFLNCPGPRTLFRDLATFSAVNSCSASVSFMLCLR